MKIPRDISGKQLIKLLGKFEYTPTRQTGSHVRITTQKNGEHHVTIPVHAELRIGTINSIISDVAVHLKMSKNDLVKILFE